METYLPFINSMMTKIIKQDKIKAEMLNVKLRKKVEIKGLTARGAAMKKALDGQCKDKYLPKGDNVHVTQYIKASNGEVTLVDYCETRSKEVSAFIKPANKTDGDPQTDTRCATEIRYRNDILLALQKKPPTMKPRPGQEFSMHNAMYQASLIDSANCGGWNDNLPKAPSWLKEGLYLHDAILAKTTAHTCMLALGYNAAQKDCIGPEQAIMKNYQHMSKYFCFSERYPNSASTYHQKINEIECETEMAISRLCYSTYINYKLIAGNKKSKAEHSKLVKATALCAFGFEPMAIWYTKAHFDSFGIGAVYKKYLEYMEVVKAVRERDQIALEEMHEVTMLPPSAQKSLEDMMPERRPKQRKAMVSSEGSQQDTPTKVLVRGLKKMDVSRFTYGDKMSEDEGSLASLKASKKEDTIRAGSKNESGTVTRTAFSRKGLGTEYPFDLESKKKDP